MTWLLNFTYLALLLACAPWLLWRAGTTGKYRRGWRARLWGASPRLPRRPRVWLHAVSVGEVQLIQPLVAELQRACPELEVVISATTDSGLALARKQHPQRVVFRFPLDFSWAIRRVLRHVQPSLVALVELELWPNLITVARQQGLPVVIINGRLGEKSAAGYQRLRPILTPVLQQLAWVGAQDSTVARRFAQLGVPADRISITGSLKFDGAETSRTNPRTQQFGRLAGFQPDDVIWLAGSTQDPEERLALDVFSRLAREFPRLKLVLVPRHPERFNAVAELAESAGHPTQRRTQLELIDECQPPRVLVVDTIGELSAWWGTAHIGFVGGSLGKRGGQNMLEPAAFAVATCFGPHTHNFRDIVQLLLRAEACRVVRNGDELELFVRACLQDETWRSQLGSRAQQVVLSHRGATQQTAARLLGCLPDLDRPRAPAPSNARGEEQPRQEPVRRSA